MVSYVHYITTNFHHYSTIFPIPNIN
jgi:hypothetical protein